MKKLPAKNMEEQMKWYLHEEGTTSAPMNHAIGITDIQVFQPSALQAENQMVAATIVKTIIGDIRVTVHQSKSYPDALYLRAPQSVEQKDGEFIYHDEVKLNVKVKAQILRHIDSLLVEAE